MKGNRAVSCPLTPGPSPLKRGEGETSSPPAAGGRPRSRHRRRLYNHSSFASNRSAPCRSPFCRRPNRRRNRSQPRPNRRAGPAAGPTTGSRRTPPPASPGRPRAASRAGTEPGPARCTRRWCGRRRATAPSAAWTSNRSRTPPPRTGPATGRATGTKTPATLAALTRRFVLAAVLAAPVLILAMGPMVGLPVEEWVSPTLNRWLQLAFTLPAVLWAGWPILARGVKSLYPLRPNMFTLIGLGVAAATLYSVIATAFPDLIPAAVFGRGRRWGNRRRLAAGLFRGGGDDRGAGAARAGARTPRPPADRGRDPRADEPRPRHRPAH